MHLARGLKVFLFTFMIVIVTFQVRADGDEDDDGQNDDNDENDFPEYVDNDDDNDTDDDNGTSTEEAVYDDNGILMTSDHTFR